MGLALLTPDRPSAHPTPAASWTDGWSAGRAGQGPDTSLWAAWGPGCTSCEGAGRRGQEQGPRAGLSLCVRPAAGTERAASESRGTAGRALAPLSTEDGCCSHIFKPDSL